VVWSGEEIVKDWRMERRELGFGGLQLRFAVARGEEEERLRGWTFGEDEWMITQLAI